MKGNRSKEHDESDSDGQDQKRMAVVIFSIMPLKDEKRDPKNGFESTNEFKLQIFTIDALDSTKDPNINSELPLKTVLVSLTSPMILFLSKFLIQHFLPQLQPVFELST